MAAPSPAPDAGALAARLGPLMRRHGSERSAARSDAERRTGAAADAAGELERDVRAAVGLQLRQADANQKAVDGGVRALRALVMELSKSVAGQQAGLDALYGAVGGLGSVRGWLGGASDSLDRTRGHLGAIEGLLTGDDAARGEGGGH